MDGTGCCMAHRSVQCKTDGYPKPARGETGFCAEHEYWNQCQEEGCEQRAQGESYVWRKHLTIEASKLTYHTFRVCQ